MTFSIVAHDPLTGAVGVATATGGPMVGSLVPHAAPGLGAIATQGYTNPLYGFDGLAGLAAGHAAADVAAMLVAVDDGRDKRQVIIIDAEGRTAGWTGPDLTPVTGMILDDGVAVAGNLLASDEVPEAMHAAYLRATDLPLERRLMAALAAGQRAGGDARGTQSAALRTYLDQPYPRYDMRIDHADDPIAALEALFLHITESGYADFADELPRRLV